MSKTTPLVMIIDDDPRYTEMLEVSLSAEGFDVQAVHDPRMVYQTAVAVKPDIIVSDIAMPQMDGYAVAAGLKADPATAGIPLIFVTAKGMSQGSGWRTVEDNISYITKPFPLPLLVTQLRKLLNERQEKEAQ